MSNNKQSMKLYTEEQVRKAIELSRDTHPEGRTYMQRDEYDYSVDEVICLLTPIEIPSDEEMRKMAKKICDGHQHAMRYNQMLNCCFNMGKSVINKIQGGNK